MMVGTQEPRLLWAGSGTLGHRGFFLLQKKASEGWVSHALPSFHSFSHPVPAAEGPLGGEELVEGLMQTWALRPAKARRTLAWPTPGCNSLWAGLAQVS